MIRKYLAITTLLLTPFAANATTWTLGGSTPAGIRSINAYSVGTSSTSTFATAAVGNYSGGLGVTTSGENTGSPEHATDNVGNIEALLFRFESSTILEKLTIGWNGGSDSDISVLRYTGSLVNDALPTDRNITGESISTLLSRGWEFVGSYNTAVNQAENINPNGLSSSFWLISAYSSRWGTGKGDPSTELTNSNDYFKLASLVGTTPGTSPGPGASVPEPTSLLLLASGIFGWRMNSKKRTLTA